MLNIITGHLLSKYLQDPKPSIIERLSEIAKLAGITSALGKTPTLEIIKGEARKHAESQGKELVEVEIPVDAGLQAHEANLSNLAKASDRAVQESEAVRTQLGELGEVIANPQGVKAAYEAKKAELVGKLDPLGDLEKVVVHLESIAAGLQPNQNGFAVLTGMEKLIGNIGASSDSSRLKQLSDRLNGLQDKLTVVFHN